MPHTLLIPTAHGLRAYETDVVADGRRIRFPGAPFALKDELKALAGARWNPQQREWSARDCPRNHFQLDYLSGQDVYGPFHRPLAHVTFREYPQPPYPHQVHLARTALTYHYQIWAAEMRTGKTLAAQMVIEHADAGHWFWVGPKNSLDNIRREFDRWGFDYDHRHVEWFSFEGLVKWVRQWEDTVAIPQGVFFDESSRLKTPTSHRTAAAQWLADRIRDQWGDRGYVIPMSGTPAPKSPLDWWAPCEIAWPGYLREGSRRQLEQRLANIQYETTAEGVTFPKRTGWKADEVAKLPGRLAGLVTVLHAKDCLKLPEKTYRDVHCPIDARLWDVARRLRDAAGDTMTGLHRLRQLSDGFLYTHTASAQTRTCGGCGGRGHYRDGAVMRQRCAACRGTGRMAIARREAKQVDCPKAPALVELLGECEETGRIVIFAAYRGSIDRIVSLCHEHGWQVVRCDGRGMTAIDQPPGTRPLDFWDTHVGRVAFVAHPESGGMSLTLSAARRAVFWSNSFKPEYRAQAEARIVGPNNPGVEIVDLYHLPSDQKIVQSLRADRRLELMTLGDFFPESEVTLCA